MSARLATLALVRAVATGCGTATSSEPQADPGSAERPTAVPVPDGPVTTTYTVLVIDDGTPHACLGGVADSLPPQCDTGVPLAGWDWTTRDGTYETSGPVRWGDYVLTGTFDGTTLTITDAVDAEHAPARPDADSPFVTPCPEPAGGWVPADPARSGERSFRELQQLAHQRDDFALLWVDQSINPAYDRMVAGETGLDVESQMNDPSKEIVNIQVTGDPAAADAELRTVWGGSLCVTQVEHTEKEVNAVLDGISTLPGFQGGGGIGIDNHADLSVTYDDGSYQRWVDAGYGDGTVVVTSLLTPVGQQAPTSG
jgi:hypothetical protein